MRVRSPVRIPQIRQRLPIDHPVLVAVQRRRLLLWRHQLEHTVGRTGDGAALPIVPLECRLARLTGDGRGEDSRVSILDRSRGRRSVSKATVSPAVAGARRRSLHRT